MGETGERVAAAGVIAEADEAATGAAAGLQEDAGRDAALFVTDACEAVSGLAAAVVPAAATGAATAAAPSRLQAGAGKAAIELACALPFDGFDELRDPLFARALVLEAHGTRVCIVSLELTSIAPALLEQLRAAASEETGCTGAALWVCATHTFSAPHVRTPGHLASDEERARNEALLAAYVTAVRAACREAASSLISACLVAGTAPYAGNVNRDVETPAGWWLGANPQGFSDHTTRTLGFIRDDGTPLALLFSADVQSSVLDRSQTRGGRRVVTGDLAGFGAATIECELGGVALFVTGAAGDQAPAEQAVTQRVSLDGTICREDAHEEGYRMLHEQGAMLAASVRAAFVGARPCEVDAIKAEALALELPGQERGDFHALAPRRSYEYVSALPVSTTAWLLRLGPVVLVGLQPEVTSHFGATLRASAPSSMFADVLTLVNGGAKYLPDVESYDKINYEAMNSGFARGAAEMLMKELLAALRQLASHTPKEA